MTVKCFGDLTPPGDVVVSDPDMSSGARNKLLALCEDVLAPLVRADGGELWLVLAEADELVLHLAGLYAGCPGTTLVTQGILEPAVHAMVPSARLTVTSGWQIPPGARRLDAPTSSTSAPPPT